MNRTRKETDGSESLMLEPMEVETIRHTPTPHWNLLYLWFGLWCAITLTQVVVYVKLLNIIYDIKEMKEDWQTMKRFVCETFPTVCHH